MKSTCLYITLFASALLQTAMADDSPSVTTVSSGLLDEKVQIRTVPTPPTMAVVAAVCLIVATAAVILSGAVLMTVSKNQSKKRYDAMKNATSVEELNKAAAHQTPLEFLKLTSMPDEQALYHVDRVAQHAFAKEAHGIEKEVKEQLSSERESKQGSSTGGAPGAPSTKETSSELQSTSAKSESQISASTKVAEQQEKPAESVQSQKSTDKPKIDTEETQDDTAQEQGHQEVTHDEQAQASSDGTESDQGETNGQGDNDESEGAYESEGDSESQGVSELDKPALVEETDQD